MLGFGGGAGGQAVQAGEVGQEPLLGGQWTVHSGGLRCAVTIV
ncbi:hypothetical protein AB0L49_46520 [Streptomyces antimycoticus]